MAERFSGGGEVGEEVSGEDGWACGEVSGAGDGEVSGESGVAGA